jgi:hypothetical protein
MPKHARWTAVKCEHCNAVAAPGMQVVSRKTFRAALARSEQEVSRGPDDVEVGGVRYRVLERLARGDRADVLLATRARALTERTVIKVMRSTADAKALDHEWDALEALHASRAQGAPHFTLRLPPLVAKGEARFADGHQGPALVFRALPGFQGTLADVRDAYPGGVDARHAVWMWRRTLELLGWVHRAGSCHGNVAPSHVLLYPREHGAMLVGWSHASARAQPDGDLVAAAKSILSVLGPSSGDAPPVLELLHACAAGRLPSNDGWELMETVAQAARRVFGPPTFVPFSLPLRSVS